MIDLGKLPEALRGLAYTLKKYEAAKSPSHSGNRDWLGPLLWLEIESFLINIGYEPEARGEEYTLAESTQLEAYSDGTGQLGKLTRAKQALTIDKQKGGDE